MSLRSTILGLLFASLGQPVLGHGPGAATSFGPHERRTINQTEHQFCSSLSSKFSKSTNSHVYTALDGPTQYYEYSEHYMSSSTQAPACVFFSTSEDDVASVLKSIGEQRVRFAIQGAGHASNKGFSSTPGVHISMKGFQQVALSPNHATVHVGPANIWDNVYAALNPVGLNVVGGRVTGVGVGGFIAGGGGYSWLSNQHGLTGDTLVSARVILPSGEIVTTSATQEPDLFWAIRGSGNKFGIITDFELKTVPQGQVYGGLRTYTFDQLPALIDAVADFSANNKDPKAQVIPTLNYILGQPGCSLLAFYDNTTASPSTFSAFSTTAAKPFTDGWKTQSFSDLVRSAPVNTTTGMRGIYQSVSLQTYSKNILNVILNETKYWGAIAPLHSGSFVSYDIEPFLNYSQWAKDAAWPHDTNALPLNIYFGWLSPLDDDFWLQAAKQSSQTITEAAKKEGQDLSDKYLYPNYMSTGSDLNALYGPKNLARIRELRAKYDPDNVMALATYFPL